MVRRFQAAIFLIAIVCFVAGNACSSEGSVKSTGTSDGIEYVYVKLNSDTQSYQIMPKDEDKWKVVSAEDKDRKNAKINADMSSYQIVSKGAVEDHLPYYRSIREKILARLKRNYTSHYSDGDVHLFFILNKEGAIVRIDVALSRSTKNTSLIDIALLSLQQAAPFGPFPKDLSVPQMPFSLIITFKKDSR